MALLGTDGQVGFEDPLQALGPDTQAHQHLIDLKSRMSFHAKG